MKLETLLVVGVAIAIPLSLFIFAFFAGFLEKHPVRMFESAQPFELPPYMSAMAARATELGFTICGFGYHTKYKEKVRALLLLSNDTCVLAVIGQGTLLGMELKKTILMSRFKDDRVLLTVDDAGTGELDDMTIRQIFMNSNLEGLVRKHSKKLEEMPLAEPFGAAASWNEVDQLYRQRADRIINRGLANYIDPQRELFRYSSAGSFRMTFIHGIGQILWPPNWFRNYKRRPGS